MGPDGGFTDERRETTQEEAWNEGEVGREEFEIIDEVGMNEKKDEEESRESVWMCDWWNVYNKEESLK